MAGEVVLLTEQHGEAATRDVPGDADAVDAATYHQQIELAVFCQGRTLPVSPCCFFLAAARETVRAPAWGRTVRRVSLQVSANFAIRKFPLAKIFGSKHK